MNNPKVSEWLQSQATDEQINSITILGLPAHEFSKEDILRAFFIVLKEKEELLIRHQKDLEFITSIR